MIRLTPLLLLLVGCAATVPRPEPTAVDARGTWVNSDSTFIAATDSTPEQHLFYTRVTLSDSAYTYVSISRTVGDSSWVTGLSAIELTYPYRMEGSRLLLELGGGEFSRRVEVKGDTLWFLDELAMEWADPLLRQRVAPPPVPDHFIGLWEGGMVTDDAGVPAIIALEILEDGTLVAAGQRPTPAFVVDRFLLLPQPKPDELAPGELDVALFDVVPFALNDDRLMLELSPGQLITFQRRLVR